MPARRRHLKKETARRVTVSELHLYEGTAFEAARDGELAKSEGARGLADRKASVAPRMSWLRRATAFVLLRKSYSRV